MADYSALLQTDTNESRHQCLIYKGSPSQKLPFLARILKNKLDEGYRCLYLNSAPLVAGMGSTLAAMDINIAEVTKDSLIFSSEQVSAGRDFSSEAMLGKLEELLNQSI